jgi:catechol 2,3-dioxygenase-like lactoylglutathione lyase family enzyme
MKRALIVVSVLVVMIVAGPGIPAQEQMGRPKIYGFAHVKFKVTDMEKAKAFYGDALEMRAGGVTNANSVYPSFVVNQYQRVELEKTEPGTKGSYLVEIGFATDDLMKMRTYLTAKGVPAGKVQTSPDGGTCFELSDPEGNTIVFVQQKRETAETGPADALSHELIHAGFVVKDRAREDRFYKDILGFRLYWHGGMKEGESNWVAMQVPDGTDWIEYMLRIPADADKEMLGVMNHISLGVVSIKETDERLKKAGVKYTDTPKTGRDGKWQLNLFDPDLTRIEFMEFTPVEKPCCAEFTGIHPKP